MEIKLHTVLVCLLSLTLCQVQGEEAAPVLHRVGEAAMLTWKLPASDADIITVSLQAPDGSLQPVLYCFMSLLKINADERYKDRIQLLDSGIAVGDGVVTFTLNSVRAEDAGRYVCAEGFGKAIIDHCGQMLVVLDKPQDVRMEASGVALEDEDLRLTCLATSTSLPPDHNQPLTVQWFNSAAEQPLSAGGAEDKVSVTGELLTVRNVQRPDKGMTFTCRAADGTDLDKAVWSVRSDPYTLDPQYPPKPSDITLDRSRAEITQGDSLSLHCSAICNPECTVTWEKEQAVDDWYVMKEKGGAMNLTSVTRNMFGNFRCRAENTHGTATKPFHLTIHYKPNFHEPMVDGDKGPKGNRKEGSNVTLACVFDSSPAPIVDWVKVNDQGQGEVEEPLLTEDLQGQKPKVMSSNMLRSLYTSHLSLGTVTCSHTGRYGCRAHNTLGSGIDGEIELHVACMPRNMRSAQRLKEMYLLPAGNRVFIQFQVEGYPQPNMEKIISEDEQFHRSLEPPETWSVTAQSPPGQPYLSTLSLVMTKDINQYFDKTFYLYIANTEGTKTLAFKLREKGAPKPPRNVSASLTEDTWVLLRFIPGFHGGKPQNFLLQYKEGLASEDGAWVTVPSLLEDTEEENVQEVKVEGLRPGRSYSVKVTAYNEHGNSSSVILPVTTMATASAGVDAGTIAGAVIAVILILLIIIAIVVFIFIVRPRLREKQKKEGDLSNEKMLGGEEKLKPDTAVIVEDSKPSSLAPHTSDNNNADRDTSTEPLLTASQTSDHSSDDRPRVRDRQTSDHSSDDRPRNQDGLIYADLDLAKPKNGSSKVKREERVNYEPIDFTKEAPSPQPQPTQQDDPDSIQPASDQEDLPARK